MGKKGMWERVIPDGHGVEVMLIQGERGGEVVVKVDENGVKSGVCPGTQKGRMKKKRR